MMLRHGWTLFPVGLRKYQMPLVEAWGWRGIFAGLSLVGLAAFLFFRFYGWESPRLSRGAGLAGWIAAGVAVTAWTLS